MMTIGDIDIIVEKYIRGSENIKLFSKDFESAYRESLEIIYDIFGYSSDKLDIKQEGDTVIFKNMEDTLLGKMKKKNDKFILNAITG